jgi:signal peptidase I
MLGLAAMTDESTAVTTGLPPDPPAPKAQPKPAAQPGRLQRFIRESRALILVVVLLLAGRSTLADWNEVPTGSMNPTIVEGDRIFVNKLAYGLKVPFTTLHALRWSHPERGQVVVFFAPHDGTRMVKRVIGVPGDKIEMRDNVLIVNGQPAGYTAVDSGQYADLSRELRARSQIGTEQVAGVPHPVMITPGVPSKRSFPMMEIPPGKYMLLGDNRDNSLDSRYWGLVDEDQIVGTAPGIVASFDPAGTLKARWNRFFRGL